MKCFQDNRKLVKKFYTTDSIMSDTPVRFFIDKISHLSISFIQRLIALGTLCSGLENIQFDLKTVRNSNTISQKKRAIIQDCVYFDRSCWPAYLQADMKDAQKVALTNVRNNVPSFTTYLSRYDVQHLPSSPAILSNSTIASSEFFIE